jgi:hypothetical protein
VDTQLFADLNGGWGVQCSSHLRAETDRRSTVLIWISSERLSSQSPANAAPIAGQSRTAAFRSVHAFFRTPAKRILGLSDAYRCRDASRAGAGAYLEPQVAYLLGTELDIVGFTDPYWLHRFLHDPVRSG